jgi:hypothetical protein
MKEIVRQSRLAQEEESQRDETPIGKAEIDQAEEQY